MALLSGGWSTFPDILIGCLLLVCCAVSIILNVFVYRFNGRSATSPTTFLYKLLASVDFLSSSICTTYYSYETLRVEKVPQSLNDITARSVVKDVSPFYIIFGVVAFILVYSHVFVIALITYLRFCKIKYPLKRLYIYHFIFALLIFMILHLSILAFLYSDTESLKWSWGLKLTINIGAYNLKEYQISLILVALPIIIQSTLLCLDDHYHCVYIKPTKKENKSKTNRKQGCKKKGS